jgi:nucleotide-binding universal stress UspA family protein
MDATARTAAVPSPAEAKPGIFRRILAPVYFDEVSTAALDYARHFARMHGGTVHLLHVVPTDEFQLLREVYRPQESGGANLDYAETVARQRLAELARTRLSDVPTEILTCRDRDPVRGILDMEEKIDADLVVLATHGRTGLAHVVLRSVAERVLRASTRPVFATRRRTEVTESHRFRTILCPVDIDERFTRALEIAREIGRRDDAKVYALHVVPTEDIFLRRDVYGQPPDAPPNLVAAERVARERLAALADRILGEVPHETVVHTSPDPGRTILETERDIGADLLVMTTHGFTGIFHLVLGSLTEKMVRRATCPVLSVRAG